MVAKWGRGWHAALALVLLVSVALACKNLTGGGGSAEADTLIKSAQDDLTEVNRIYDENEDKRSQIIKAIDNNQNAEAKQRLNEAIDAIDKGTARGTDAANKIQKASGLVTDATFKEYLSLKAQAFQKQVDAFKSLRQAAVILRDALDGQFTQQAKTDFTDASNKYKSLIQDANALHRKADDIARAHPDIIKPS